MRFGIFDKFGALNSAPVFDAFCQGLDQLGFQYASHDVSADVAVIWSVVWAGRMKRNQEIWTQFRNSNRPVIVLEVGALKRGSTWKIGVNGIGRGCYDFKNLDQNRPKKLGLTMLPWKENGQHIVIALQRSDSYQWIKQPPMESWLETVCKELRLYTDRPIVIRQHPRQKCAIPMGYAIDAPEKLPDTYDDFNLIDSIQNAWAVINHNSGLGVQSIMSGVPAFVDVTSLAYPVANRDFGKIEQPRRPERDQWIIEISHTEWSTQEIAEGQPLRRLLPIL